MAQTSPSEIRVGGLHQIGIVVKDLEKTVKDYWELLGIGPWTIIDMHEPGIYDLTYNGKPTSYAMKIALVQLGDLEFELMQTVKGHTAYDDFVGYNGEGANHLNYLVENVDEINRHIEIMAKKGYPSVMGGLFGDNGGFNYIDLSKDLKTIWEPVKMADDFSALSMKPYPASETETSLAKVKVEAITRVGLVVKDPEQVMKNYEKLLAIGSWEVCEVKPPILHGQTYHGKPGNFTMKASFTKVGEVELELVQPVAGENIYRDFIEQQGEGIHHVQFVVEDIDKTTELMNKAGFPTLMSGRFSDGGFAYYDTVEPLKIVWEAVQPPKTKSAMTFYP